MTHSRSIPEPAPRSLARSLALAALVLLAPFLQSPLLAADRNVRFQRISVEQGLSQSSIRCIYQDRRGFLWFGTEDGLNRYDGYTFTVYKHNPSHEGSLSNNYVNAILQDGDGVLWVGTLDGLNRWDPNTDRFTVFENDPQNPTSLSEDRVRVIYEDSNGQVWVGTDGGLNRFERETQSFTRFNHNPSNPHSLQHDVVYEISEDVDSSLWIGTYGGGLDRFYPLTGVFEHHRHDPADPESLSDDRVWAIQLDSSGNLWAGTEVGLNKLKRESGGFERYRHDPHRPESLSNDYVTALLEDDQGTLWVATLDGLNALERSTGRFTHYRNDPADPASLSHDSVWALFQDNGGILWVGTRVGGINKWNATTGAFVHYKHDSVSPTSLGHNVVTSFWAEQDETLWIGTFGGGLDRLDRTSEMFEHYRHAVSSPQSLSDDKVMSLLVDATGTLWVGTFAGGLNRLDPATGGFVHYRHDASDPGSLSADGIMALTEDRDGIIWIGTFGGGLTRLDPAVERFVRYQHSPQVPTTLGHDRVSALHEDSLGALWVGTRGGGLDRFDRANGTFTHYRHDPENPSSLSHDVIYSIYEDSGGTLWIGTGGTALCAWSREDRETHRGVFRRYYEEDGLPNAVVYGILEDDEGFLWFSTNRGISKFDPRTETFTSYDVTHGLQSNEFNYGAYHESPGGEMFFGGINGFNAFFPDRIRDNRHVPPVLLTAFLKLNQRVELGKPVFDIDEIDLGFEDDVVSFEFAALDFSAPEKNRYAYKLEGFDHDWIQLGNLRRATYTNLDAGTYTFRVKGSNNDGVWNEEGAAVILRVEPPPWKTWWAYSIYALVPIALFTAYSRAQFKKLEREAEYSRKLELQVAERTQELAQRNEELEVLNERLQEASLTDALTGLGNRRFLMGHLEKEVAMTLREYTRDYGNEDRKTVQARDLLLLMVDLDRYKEINDRHGHAAGDEVLLQVRQILKNACRTSDTVVRWGGDEFLVVGRTSDNDSCRLLAERIRSMIEEHPFDVGTEEPVRTTCSIGFASFPFLPSAPELLSWEQVLAIADRALYVAKNSGRNAWVGLFSTQKTPTVGVLDAVLTRAEWLHEQGELQVLTSFDDVEGLRWATA